MGLQKHILLGGAAARVFGVAVATVAAAAVALAASSSLVLLLLYTPELY